MKVTIVGSGNIGTQFAVEFKRKGYYVTLYDENKKNKSKRIEMINDDNNEFFSIIVDNITNDLHTAVKDAEIILVTYPSFLFEGFSDELYKHIKEGVMIGIIPGLGGPEFYFNKHIINKKAILFGLQRVPNVARKIEDNIVRTSGKRKTLFLSSIPSKHSEHLCSIFSNVFDMECIALPNFLNVTLTPSNPILHTTRLKIIFEDYKKGVFYSNEIMFYEDWDLRSSDLLLKCDAELQMLVDKISELNLNSVRSLREHYNSNDSLELTEKIKSIKSLRNIKTPMIRTNKGYIPDFKNRYFKADFPYGLEIIKEISLLFNNLTPNIDEVLDWYYKITDTKKEFYLRNFGINTIEDFIRIYNF